MSIEISEGFQYAMAAAIAAALNDTIIKIYGDATSQAAADALIPDKAGDSIGSATLLSTITVDGNGTALTFDQTPINGAVYKTSDESWLGTNAESGYPSFYRLQFPTDDGSESTTNVRQQGTVGQYNADLIIKATYMIAGEEQRVDNFLVGIPKE